jgi:hypothetical protein
MRRPPLYAGLLGFLALAACSGSEPTTLPPVTTDTAAPAVTTAAVTTAPTADAGSALVEARRCGRAIAVATRCNFLRDDRDVAALRFSVLQGLGQRYGSVVDEPRLTEAVDLAVLDRMATIGQCSIRPSDVPVVQNGLREVLGTCTAQ